MAVAPAVLRYPHSPVPSCWDIPWRERSHKAAQNLLTSCNPTGWTLQKLCWKGHRPGKNGPKWTQGVRLGHLQPVSCSEPAAGWKGAKSGTHPCVCHPQGLQSGRFQLLGGAHSAGHTLPHERQDSLVKHAHRRTLRHACCKAEGPLSSYSEGLHCVPFCGGFTVDWRGCLKNPGAGPQLCVCPCVAVSPRRAGLSPGGVPGYGRGSPSTLHYSGGLVSSQLGAGGLPLITSFQQPWG